jgi:hypothetical protein
MAELFIAALNTAVHVPDEDDVVIPCPPPLNAKSHWKQASPIEALTFSVVTFGQALAAHLGRTYEEADQLIGRTPFNLWPLVDSPEGWTALGLLLSPPGNDLPYLVPTVH